MFAEPTPAGAPRFGSANSLAALGALGAIALALGFGLTELYRLRFSGGDTYPAASSLRADPLGAKVLYEALRETPGVEVGRHLRPLSELEGARDTVVLLLGLRPEDVELESSSLLRDAEALAGAGSRVVLAFAPLAGETWSEVTERPAGASEAPRPTRGWRIGTRALQLSRGDAGVIAEGGGEEGIPAGAAAALLEPAAFEAGLPATLAVHSTLTFDAATVDDRTRVIYRREGAPVVVERRDRSRPGGGSLVLVADGFLFANEGLSRDREPAVLAWALGGARRVIFDESHLGVEEVSGVMVLARRYRLLPVLVVLAVLAALFVWRSASGLLPAARQPASEDRAAAGEARSGLADLLARGLDRRELLPLCARRWAEDCARGETAAARSVVELALQAKDPVTGYREIRDALATSPFRRGDHAD